MRSLAASRTLKGPGLRTCAALALAAVGACSLGAQTFAAITGTDAVIVTHPNLDQPRIARASHHADAEQPMLFGRVRDGVYTVDGMVAKVRLNYDVNGARFLYLFVPGVGTAVLSAAADEDAVNVEARLHDNELSFTAGDHQFKLTGVALSDGHNNVPDHLFVHLDRAAWHLNRHPMVGFGNEAALPYAWPGALPQSAEADEKELIPPVPVALLPSVKAVRPAAATATPVSLR